MCGSRHGCSGQSQRRQPLIAQAATLAYATYNERKQRKAIAGQTYPETLDAAQQAYPAQPAMPYAANRNAMYTERDEKAPIPITSIDGPSNRDSMATAPPAYEDVAPPPGPPSTRDATEVRGQHYPQHPAVRPRVRRNSSASSISSASSASSVSTSDIRGPALNPSASGTPVISPAMINKKMLKKNRKALRLSLKHSQCMEQAKLAVLTSMAGLFGFEHNAVRDFGQMGVDGNAAVLLTVWARVAAKSRVSPEVVGNAGSMDGVAAVIAGGSKKVRCRK